MTPFLTPLTMGYILPVLCTVSIPLAAILLSGHARDSYAGTLSPQLHRKSKLHPSSWPQSWWSNSRALNITLKLAKLLQVCKVPLNCSSPLPPSPKPWLWRVFLYILGNLCSEPHYNTTCHFAKGRFLDVVGSGIILYLTLLLLKEAKLVIGSQALYDNLEIQQRKSTSSAKWR